MEYTVLIYELRNQTAWIYLNRPKEMNSISGALIVELGHSIDAAEQDEKVKVIVLSGKGRAFCAGADLKAFMDSLKAPNLHEPDFLNQCENTFNKLRSVTKPTIAALNGLAIAGGLELTMCCDLVYAAQSAKLGDSHANFGVFPGAGGAAVLPKKIGLTRAKYLLFTGEMVTAEQMAEYGLVNKVTKDEALEQEVQMLADSLSEKSSLVLSRMKRVVNDAMDMPQSTALRNELLTLRDHVRSHDMNEGITAFIEKRKPVFKGR